MLKRLCLILLLAAPPALAEPIRVVADIAPLHALTARVMQGAGTPELLIGQTADPHDFQLRPSQARTLARADLLIWTGPALTPWLAQTWDSLSDGARLDLLPPPDKGAVTQPQNPHAWLDPDNARTWLAAIAGTLAGRDPDNAGLYLENAAAADREIAALDAAISERMKPFRDRPLVTGHAAYDYFLDQYGLTRAGTIRAADDAPPSAANLSALRAQVEAGQVACLFRDPLESDRLIATLARGTDVPVGVLDPIGVGLAPGPALYEQLMLALADAISGCLTAE